MPRWILAPQWCAAYSWTRPTKPSATPASRSRVEQRWPTCGGLRWPFEGKARSHKARCALAAADPFRRRSLPPSAPIAACHFTPATRASRWKGTDSMFTVLAAFARTKRSGCPGRWVDDRATWSNSPVGECVTAPIVRPPRSNLLPCGPRPARACLRGRDAWRPRRSTSVAASSALPSASPWSRQGSRSCVGDWPAAPGLRPLLPRTPTVRGSRRRQSNERAWLVCVASGARI